MENLVPSIWAYLSAVTRQMRILQKTSESEAQSFRDSRKFWEREKNCTPEVIILYLKFY